MEGAAMIPLIMLAGAVLLAFLYIAGSTLISNVFIKLMIAWLASILAWNISRRSFRGKNAIVPFIIGGLVLLGVFSATQQLYFFISLIVAAIIIVAFFAPNIR